MPNPSDRCFVLRVAALGAAVAAFAGCASTADRDAASGHTVSAEAAGTLRKAVVFVACETTEPAIRGVCREQLAAEMSARGSRPVDAGPAAVAPAARTADERLLADARAAGARTVLLMTATPVAVAEPGPAFSIGVGSFGFGRGSAVGGGVGVTAPLGSARVSTAFVATGRVIDVATGRTVWTARTSAPPSQDLASQFGSLAISLLDVADRDGLF